MTHKYLFPETYGLVLCGGKSSRMGTDKSMLQYYDKPQRYHVYGILQPYCEKVFISCDAVQLETMDPGYPVIPDEKAFSNMGPMGALLTAFSQFPTKNILLTGCDYPFLKADELERFSVHCKKAAATFYNKDAAIYESMLGWYPYTCREELTAMLKAGEFSLQQLLSRNNAIKYFPADTNCIKSIDTMEAYLRTCKLINAG
ncbi:MAG: molybdenum cofactor guanylyltransferase [Ferruginibacter sp.]